VPSDPSEPTLVAGTPADRARDEFGDLDADAIRELLTSPELTSEQSDELEALLAEVQAANARDLTTLPVGPDPDPDPEPVGD
jgi:hypothetical protein